MELAIPQTRDKAWLPEMIRPRDTAGRRNWRGMAAIGGVALLAVAFIVVARSSILPAIEPASDAPAPATAPATVPADQSAQLARPKAPAQVLQPAIIRKVSTAPVTVPAADRVDLVGRFHLPVLLKPPYAAIDSVALEVDDKRVRLAFLDGLGRNDICIDSQGLRFACGLRGRASLVSMVSGRALTCWPVFGPGSGQGDTVTDEAVMQCFADGQDIGRRQTEAGFARPAGLTGPLYGEAAASARLAAQGAWDGGWRFAPPPGSTPSAAPNLPMLRP